MPEKSADKENSAIGVKPIAPWRLTNVTPMPNYKLAVTFNDGVQGIVDMQNLIMSDEAGVFAILREVELFKKVYLEYGAVTWPGDIDLSPDMMYDEIKKKGKWVL